MNVVMSPRFRYRYLPRILAGFGAAAVIAAAVFIATNVLSNDDANGTGTLSNEPAAIANPNAPATVPLDKAVIPIAGEFINTAVTRKDLARSWALLGACVPDEICLKQGMTRKEWLTGDIPVVPYPAYGGVKFRTAYSYANDALLEVLTYPRRGSKMAPAVFQIQLHKYGKGDDATWKVLGWTPRNSPQTGAVPAASGF